MSKEKRALYVLNSPTANVHTCTWTHHFILKHEPVDIILIYSMCYILSDRLYKDKICEWKWVAKFDFVPKIAQENTAPCQGWSPLLA